MEQINSQLWLEKKDDEHFDVLFIAKDGTQTVIKCLNTKQKIESFMRFTLPLLKEQETK